jgi:3-hydroxyacyl-[acyl-carrier-protein] dehydratase
MTTTAPRIRVDARRLPLLAVDGVDPVDGGFVGRKRIVADDPYLRGHFPSLTVYPGVFVIESVQQMVELYLDGALGGLELAEIASVRFSRPAQVGDELVFRTSVTGDRTRLTTRTTVTGAGRRCARITATWRGTP